MIVQARHPLFFSVWRRSLVLGSVLVCLLFLSGCVSSQTRQKFGLIEERALSLSAPKSVDSRVEPALEFEGQVERAQIVALSASRSPELQGLAHRVRALVHAGRAEGALPTAELGFEVWNLPLTQPYALGEADMYMVDLRQRFPSAGSLDARARAWAEEAEALLGELVNEERAVTVRAADVFADYVEAYAERELVERQLSLFQQMRLAIQARYATAGASLAEVARLDVEVSKSERALARANGEIERAKAALNALLRRPVQAPLGAPLRSVRETVRLPLEELITRALASRGSQMSAEAKLRAALARQEAAKAEAEVPEFMVGLGYWQHPGMRPGLGLSASMSLPWLWGPLSHRLEQAAAEAEAERASLAQVGLEAQREVSEALAELGALEAELGTVERRSLPAAQRAQQALTAAYSTGRASLLEWVDATRSLLELELEVITLEAELARGVQELERAVGTSLPRVALERE